MPDVAINLKIVGAGEDYPRLLTGYRSFRGGVQIALAMRPLDKRILLSVSQKDGTAVLHHAVGQDAPAWPTGASTAAEVSKLLKAAQQKLPKSGPIVMRGQWRAKLYADIEAQTVRVVLVRKVASYGTLTITGAGGGWTYRFDRAARWFAASKGGGSMSGANYKTLIEATQRGYATALDLVGQACGTRDTRRRQSLDPDYAEKRPIRVPKVRATEPLDRFKLPKPKRGKAPRKKAGSCDAGAKDCKSLQSGGHTVPVARTAPALSKQAKALKADAEALTNTAVPKPAMSAQAVHDWYINQTSIPGMLDLAQRVHDYTHGRLPPLDRTVPLDDFIAQLRIDTDRIIGKYETSSAMTGRLAEATAAITALEMALRSAPQQLSRVRNLIGYAEAAAQSRLCDGPEADDAHQAIERARASYEEARKALAKGGETAAIKALRQSAAWLALSASRIAAACKAGQLTIINKDYRSGGSAFLTLPTTATAKAWVKDALQAAGVTVKKITGKKDIDGDFVVTITVPAGTSPDHPDLIAIAARAPDGIHVAIEGLGSTGKVAAYRAAPKPRSATPDIFQPRIFTIAVPRASNKKAAFQAAQEKVSRLIKPAAARSRLHFEPAKRGSWTLEMVANTALVANALERQLSSLDLSADLAAPAKKAKKTTAKKSAKKTAADGMSAKDALMMQAFQQAIAAAVASS